MATVALVTVAVGRVYERFARNLMVSAECFFRPTEDVRFVTLPGIPGWPQATITRPSILAEWLASGVADSYDYVFLIDADARFEDFVGPEILPKMYGITATLHPGYVGKPADELPYERDIASVCAITNGQGGSYFCGGFVGGGRQNLLSLMMLSADLIRRDAEAGRVPVWHDESSLNRALLEKPPEKVLMPSYCMPDNDRWYRSWWPEQYERKIVMLDKTPAQRGRR